MADSLTTPLQPSDGSIRCQIGNTFLILESGTFQIDESLLVGIKTSTANPSTILIYADTIEMTAQNVNASGCNVGLFCRSFSIGSFPWASIMTTGHGGVPVGSQNAALTADNNGQDAGSISVYIEEYEASTLQPTMASTGRTGLWLEAHGGAGGVGANYVTGPGGGSDGGNGGNGGKVQFCYVSAESSLINKMQKVFSAKSPPFRARIAQLGKMAPPDSGFQSEAAWFETLCKPIDGLLLTLSRVKHIFRKIMPQDTLAALNQAESSANALLQRQDEPNVYIQELQDQVDSWNKAATTIAETSVESNTISWSDFKTQLEQIASWLDDYASGDGLPEHLEQGTYAFNLVLRGMRGDINTLNQSLARSYSGLGGPGGQAGQGGDQSANSGNSGATVQATIQDINLETPGLGVPLAYVHPDQCQMLLDVANQTYLAASCDDSDQTSNRYSQAQKLYKAIYNRLTFVPLLQDDIKNNKHQPLTELYVQMQTDQLCLDALTDLEQIRLEAGLYLCNIAHGKDMFGHGRVKNESIPSSPSITTPPSQDAPRWVPRLPYQNYSKAIQGSLPALNDLVSGMNSQQGKQQDAQYNSELEVTSVDAHIETLQQQIELATSPTGPLNAAGSQIQHYTPALKAMRASVHAQVDALTDFSSSWNFNPSDIINGISQFAANPTALTGGMSILSELYTADTTVNNNGTDVNKDYVVQQFASTGKTLEDLNEAVKMTASGTLSVDDPGAAKLLADEQTLDNLITQFQGALSTDKVETLQKSLNEYAKLAKRRNAAVLQYNAAVVMLFKSEKELKYFNDKKSNLSAQELMSGPLQGSLMLFEFKTFNSMCSTVYELRYDAARSMQFWTLYSDAQVDPPLPTSGFNDVKTVQAIQSYVELLEANFTSWLASYSINPGFVFPNPSTPSAETSGGITWFLTAEQVTALQSNTVADPTSSTGEMEHQINITLPAPTSKSTVTTGDPNYNPFAGYANVRLDQVLVWLFGATVKPDPNTQQSCLTIEMSQMGNDAIAPDDGTTPLKFEHSTTQLKFAYDPTGVASWPQALKTNPIIVQNLDSGGVGVGRDSAKTERNLSVAPIGPFATWLLTVRERENNGLDLSKLTGVCLEFWGSASTVNVS
ncbi:serine kinase [Fusarium sp. NRRL 52700]|nr:serine kinase [Fusarium sp. NRRL 52700]